MGHHERPLPLRRDHAPALLAPPLWPPRRPPLRPPLGLRPGQAQCSRALLACLLLALVAAAPLTQAAASARAFEAPHKVPSQSLRDGLPGQILIKEARSAASAVTNSPSLSGELPGDKQPSAEEDESSSASLDGVTLEAKDPSARLAERAYHRRVLAGLSSQELSEQIVGSSLEPGQKTAEFRERWKCLTSVETAQWKIDPKPRLLAWPERPFGPCWRKKGFLGAQSNALVLSGEYTEANWNVSDGLKVVWQPKAESKCGPPGVAPPSFVSFNGEEFCATMRKRGGSLFILGDSFTAHFFLSLLDQLSISGIPWSPVPPTAWCAAFLRTDNANGKCSRVAACARGADEEGAVMVHFVVTNFLGKVYAYEESEEQNSLFGGLQIAELVWGQEMVRENASVVIFNRGAHWVPLGRFEAQLNYTFREVRKLLPGALLVYRSANTGHPGCDNFTEPIPVPMDLTNAPNAWGHFQAMNDRAKGIVEAAGGVFFDMAPMTSLRPDWHLGGRDCLHLCLPGPVTDWVTMFAKFLTELVNGVGTTTTSASGGSPAGPAQPLANQPAGPADATTAGGAPGQGPGSSPGGSPGGAAGQGAGSAVGAAVGAADGSNRTGGAPGVEGAPVAVEGIAGTRLRTPAAAQAFRERWKCLTSLETCHWALDPNPRILPWEEKPMRPCDKRPGYLGRASNEQVAAGEFNSTYWPVSDSLKYVWEPKNSTACGAEPAPSFVSFDAEEFCATLRGRTILILGDSFGAFTWNSIRDSLATSGKPCAGLEPTPHCAALIKKHGQRCFSCMVCGDSLAQGAVRIYFAVTNYLGKLHERHPTQEALFRHLDVPELAWGEEAVRLNASVLILNRGAHFVGTDSFRQQMEWSFKEIRSLLPNALLVYRSTPPGHPHCNKYKTPIENPLDLTQLENYVGIGAPQAWKEHAAQNELARQIVESVGGVYFDVQPLMSLRPEWHPGGHDCLHWCMPGPVDDWIKMISKMLKELIV